MPPRSRLGETFKLIPETNAPEFAIRTHKGTFLTAVGGGGHASGDTIHTDATTVGLWELFNIFRRLDFGPKSTYQITAAIDFLEPLPPYSGGILAASHGGGPGSGLILGGEPWTDTSWILLKQHDGTYALQSSHGKVVTAISGGLPGAGFSINTPADEIGDFEKFTIEDNGEGSNFTARIKTHVGTYLSMSRISGTENIGTSYDVNDVMDWQFRPISL